MDPTVTRRTSLAIRRIGRLVLMLGVALTLLGACTSKAPAVQAQDELNAGLAADAAGNHEAAANHYKACLAVEATNNFCIFNLGVQAQNAGRAQEAENSYRLALLQDPDFPSALYNLAILRVAAGSIQEGIDLYKHLIQVDPNNASAHFNLGLALAGIGDTVNGEREINEGIRLNPELIPPDTLAGPSSAPAYFMRSTSVCCARRPFRPVR